MIINKENIESINELYLHDMELKDIKIDYFAHKVEILLKEQNSNHRLVFDNIQKFSIEIFEPWGEGVYISEVKVITSYIENQINLDGVCIINEETFLTEILINSGDKIRILSTKLQFV